MSDCYLEYYAEEQKALQRIYIDHFPFTVGRHADVSFTLNSIDVSRRHAEFVKLDDTICLFDLGSANGTYVNRKRVTEREVLHHGDIIHFANMEFRFIEKRLESSSSLDETQLGIPTLSSLLPQGLQELQELIDNRLITAEFQPIIRVEDYSTYGYEILGRGCHPELPASPTQLFRIAESAGLAVSLSEVLRRKGIESANNYDENLSFFVNTHPRELDNPDRLLESLSLSQKENPAINLTLEIHEEALTDLSTMKKIKKQLHRNGVRLAYDDFGSGQARLMELIEVPPDCLKFDICLISNIDRASSVHVHMVETLVKLAKESGIMVLAEGIDNKNQVEVCKHLGFDLLQGYLFN